jgi:dTDP-glucose 4,6-dehydratase
MMTSIATGGAGFIGSNFIFHLPDTDPDTRVIRPDKLTCAGNLFTLAPVMDIPQFHFLKADICGREVVTEGLWR